jgi:hypothetical protein
MSKKTASTSDSEPMAAVIDAANSSVKVWSSHRREVVAFESVLATMTRKRNLDSETKPRFTLVHGGQRLVFGAEDVRLHGTQSGVRRFNSMQRYDASADSDWMHLIRVALLQAFPQTRGTGETIKPIVILTVPISVYNDEMHVEEFYDAFVGRTFKLEDIDGCSVSIYFDPKRFKVQPEGVGALFHYAFDPQTLRVADGRSVTGTTLVLDEGYETINLAWFDGMAYNRERSGTLERMGFGVVVRDLLEALSKQVRGIDESHLDLALRDIAGSQPHTEKWIQVTRGMRLDVAAFYDRLLADRTRRVVQQVLTNYPERPTRLLLSGGAAHHTGALYADAFRVQGWQVVSAPDPDCANVLGLATYLRKRARA